MFNDIAGFDWDIGNQEKCCKHGVSLPEIESLFACAIAVLPDPAHSQTETRFKAIGRTPKGRGIFIVFTLRAKQGRTYIRPVSARYMHKNEIEDYEKAIPRTEQ